MINYIQNLISSNWSIAYNNNKDLERSVKTPGLKKLLEIEKLNIPIYVNPYIPPGELFFIYRKTNPDGTTEIDLSKCIAVKIGELEDEKTLL